VNPQPADVYCNANEYEILLWIELQDNAAPKGSSSMNERQTSDSRILSSVLRYHRPIPETSRCH
jgi:hypothetical protein